MIEQTNENLSVLQFAFNKLLYLQMNQKIIFKIKMMNNQFFFLKTNGFLLNEMLS